MVRKTPLPLLSDLAVEVLVIRCPRCSELVLFAEMCRLPLESACCPRRDTIEREPVLPVTGVLVLPLATLQGSALDG